VGKGGWIYGHHSAFDNQWKEKLLQPSALIGAQQIELNSHLVLADGSHHCSGTEKRFGAVGHVEGDSHVRTQRHGAGRLDHHAVQAEVDCFALQFSLIRAEANFGPNWDAAKAALFLFDGALRDSNQPLQARRVDGLIQKETGTGLESIRNGGRAQIVANYNYGRSLVETGTASLLREVSAGRRHRKIEQHHIKFLIAQISDGIGAFRQCQGIQTGRAQNTLNQLAHSRFVVND
jgi:hypothetical protein